LAEALNDEGPIIKSVQQWQDWWRKQVHDARQDAAAIAEVQRSTGGGRAPGFNGRVLQLTGTLRLTGVRPLDYQRDDAPPTAPMEVVQGMATSSTSERQPPAAPPRRRPVRPPRQPRARRVDVLSDMQLQCARSLEQGTDLLRKRKKCESDDAPPLNKRSRSKLSCNPSDFDDPDTSGIDHDALKEGVTAEGQHCLPFLFSLKVPSKYWSFHQLPDLDGVLYCTSTYLEEGVVTSDKVVMFLCDRQPDVYCKVFMRGRLIEQLSLRSQEEAENVLKSVQAAELCVGALNATDYEACFLTEGLQRQLKIRHGTYFNTNCSGKVTNKGT
ncbi:hypothetical protein MTO96_044455, partial [Rhipicephalus appendiculatus]